MKRWKPWAYVWYPAGQSAAESIIMARRPTRGWAVRAGLRRRRSWNLRRRESEMRGDRFGLERAWE